MRAEQGAPTATIEPSVALSWAERFQRLAIALVEAHGPREVLDAVVTFGIAHAGARAGVIALLDPEGERLEVAASRGVSGDAPREPQTIALAANLPLARAVHQRQPLFIGSRAERDALFPELSGQAGPDALVCLPLIAEGRTLGALALEFEREQEFGEDRRRFKLAVARQAAYALERARLLEAEQRLSARMRFLATAGDLLSSSLDYRQTLGQLAELVVPQLADWCTVDMLSEDGARIERVAVAHVDPTMVAFARQLGERYPPRLDAAHGVGAVLRTHEPELVPEITDAMLVEASAGDAQLLEIVRRLELRSAITVPLIARSRPLGALTLIRSGQERRYTKADLELAVELARRAATAVDNALLFQQTQRQAEAARALAHVAEAVLLVDRHDVVRYWNTAAERLFGLAAKAVVGRDAAEAVPSWRELVDHVPAVAEPATSPVMLPVAGAAGERWCSVVAIDFGEGRVYSLRDVTAERELERTRSDFLATASHELRTPLAAIYGASRTLRRTDVDMPEEQRDVFLEMIERESERLRTITNQLLVAGRLDAGRLELAVDAVDLVDLVDESLQSAKVAAPESIEFHLIADGEGLRARADADMLRQVLVNLLDNAVKYSPAGGRIEVRLHGAGPYVEIVVADQGIGVPRESQQRVFEKFFRADPNLNRGVGGTGLGLYIAKELIERMDGTVTLESSPNRGSTFTLRLPRAPLD